MKEIWKDIKGYEGLYQVSSTGNIKSLNYNNQRIEKIVKPFFGGNGYLRIYLYKNKIRKLYAVHRLVAKEFPEICGEWFEGAEVDHINGNKTDNRAINLRTCTHSQNIKYMYENKKKAA